MYKGHPNHPALIEVATIDPTMHDSCINYANMIFYIEINRDIKGGKKD